MWVDIYYEQWNMWFQFYFAGVSHGWMTVVCASESCQLFEQYVRFSMTACAAGPASEEKDGKYLM